MTKKRFLELSMIIVAFLSLAFPASSEASRTQGKFGLDFKSLSGKKTAFDCESMYLLTEDQIIKFSLPELTRTGSVDLPLKTKGVEIKLIGQCSDAKQTLLVLGNKKLIERPQRGQGLILLSYNEDLVLVSSKDVKDEFIIDDSK